MNVSTDEFRDASNSLILISERFHRYREIPRDMDERIPTILCGI
jgi:hypothetical protein